MKEIYLLGEITIKLENAISQLGFKPIRRISKNDNIIAIVVRGGVPVKEDLITSLPNLKLILSAGIGYDNIDIDFADKNSILVANCPMGSTISTAEHSFALFLSAVKGISKTTTELKSDVWDRKSNINYEVFGKTMGVVGMGRIGSYLAKLYRSLGLNVIGYDPYVHNTIFKRAGIKRINNLNQLCEQSNYLSLHVNKTKETTNLISADMIKSMQDPNGIVNTCRGGVIEEKVLITLLKNSLLDFYASDVFDNEPIPNKELIELDNVICSPHIAANTFEAQEQIVTDVISQLSEVLIENRMPSYLIS